MFSFTFLPGRGEKLIWSQALGVRAPGFSARGHDLLAQTFSRLSPRRWLTGNRGWEEPCRGVAAGALGEGSGAGRPRQ